MVLFTPEMRTGTAASVSYRDKVFSKTPPNFANASSTASWQFFWNDAFHGFGTVKSFRLLLFLSNTS